MPINIQLKIKLLLFMDSKETNDAKLLSNPNETTMIVETSSEKQEYCDMISVGSTIINFLLATGPFSFN